MPFSFELSKNKKLTTGPLAAMAVAAMVAPAIHQKEHAPEAPAPQAIAMHVKRPEIFTWSNQMLFPQFVELVAQSKTEHHHTHHHHHPKPKHLTPAEIASREVTPTEYQEWSKVNICEEGGNWHVRGGTYSGGLGESNVNWDYYGGTEFAPNAADATPDEQIVVAERIQETPPDQNGCDGSW